MKSKVKKLIDIINLALDKQPTPLTLMEVCGSHTAALAKNGIPELFRGKIQFLSGPGCPVCVTSTAYIDRLIEIDHEKIIIVCCVPVVWNHGGECAG